MRPTADQFLKEYHFLMTHISALGVQLWISCKACQQVRLNYSRSLPLVARRYACGTLREHHPLTASRYRRSTATDSGSQEAISSVWEHVGSWIQTSYDLVSEAEVKEHE